MQLWPRLVKKEMYWSKKYVVIICPFLFFLFIRNSAMSQQICACQDELQGLVKKVESTYPGYRHKITEDKKAAYNLFTDSLMQAAKGLSTYDCYTVLKAYTNHFKDGHLLVYEFPNPTGAEKAKPAKDVITYNITDAFARNYLAQDKTFDAVEGIWENSDYSIAILPSAVKDEFVGTVLTTKNKDWKQGQVKVRLRKKEKHYEAVYYRGDHAVIRMDASASKNVILNIGSFGWIKTFPVSPELKYHNPHDPSLPTFTSLSNITSLLTVPNFQIPQQVLDSVLLAHLNELSTRPNLIIDVRGNIGGDFIYYNILSLVNTGPMVSDKAKVLASEENIQYAKDMIAATANGAKPDSALVALRAAMEKAKGEEINYLSYPPITFDSVFTAIKKVYIITDMANISSVEAFLLYAKQSKKVKQVGEATGGVIDYQQVRAIPFGCKGSAYYLYYPTYFRDGLPNNSINKTGIIPGIIMNVWDKMLISKVRNAIESDLK